MSPISFTLKFIHKLNPKYIWYINSLLSKYILESGQFVISFDCDTKEDADVALDVHKKLQDMGITPVYAVPGELLKRGEKVYRKIHETGAEFINHGGREHTYFDNVNKRHASCFFYDQQSQEDLREDILLGHRALQEVLGVTANGWRTPHFGTFQKPEYLNFLYAVLKEFNYQFSTSTSPVMAYQHGPLFKRDGIIEIPVTGIYSEPFNIMDTWAYFAAPDRIKSPVDYIQDAARLSKISQKNPILINIYGDPSHICDKPEFFDAMELFVKTTKNTNYSKLIESIYS